MLQQSVALTAYENTFQLSGNMKQKVPLASNRRPRYLIVTALVITLLGLLYFLSPFEPYYDKDYYEKISGIRIPATNKVIESYDNGEFWTATSFRLDKDSLKQFIQEAGFTTSSASYKPFQFGAASFKVEKPDSSTAHYLYKIGIKGKNSWVYIIDPEKHILWAEIQYPDWAGD